MKKQKKEQEVTLEESVKKARELWSKYSKLFPFKTEEEYIKWVKDGQTYVSSLSEIDRKKYLTAKKGEIEVALKNLTLLKERKTDDKKSRDK